jgi:hypothetical protein
MQVVDLPPLHKLPSPLAAASNLPYFNPPALSTRVSCGARAANRVAWLVRTLSHFIRTKPRHPFIFLVPHTLCPSQPHTFPIATAQTIWRS